MSEVRNFLHSKGFWKLLTILILILFLYSIGNLLNLLLFTFIFTFLMGRLQSVISARLNRYIHINPKIIVLLLYTVVVSALVLVLYKYLPVITLQLTELIKQIVHFYQNPPDIKAVQFIINAINDMDPQLDIQNQINTLYQYLSGISEIAIQVFIAMILSLFLLLERKEIIQFTSRFKYSKVGQIFDHIEHFGRKFTNSFGKVIEVQFMIATTNSILSTFFLWILGFPQLLGLAIMIFILGLIPVAGVIISLIPLSMIAYSIGGITKVIAVFIMIMVIHAIEAYILNPKFMSVKTNLPTFFTLTVLLFSEHFFGTWGLIIGIPIFIFILDLMEVPEESGKKIQP
jgi:predicted PurR-regulated permease PerM